MTDYDALADALEAAGLANAPATTPEERRAHQLEMEQYREARARAYRTAQTKRVMSILQDRGTHLPRSFSVNDELQPEYHEPAADAGWGD